MANFHNNLLSVATDGDGMIDILKIIASNLSSSSDIVDPPYVDDAMSTEDMFLEIAPYIDSYYWEIFSKDDEFSGRPLSDTASVHMVRFGNNYVLTIYYSTAWCSNEDDLGQLFESVQPGCYGIAFLDADECDWFSTINSHEYLAIKKEPGFDFDVIKKEAYGVWDIGEILKTASSRNESDINTSTDLVLMAFLVAVEDWPKSEAANGYFKINASDREDLHAFDPPRKLFSDSFWSPDSERKIQRINELILKVIDSLPQEYLVNGQGYKNRNGAIDLLVPESGVQLVSDWDTQYFNTADIEVFDNQGRKLASLGSAFESLDIDERVALACLLPYIRATAVNVRPLSTEPNRKLQDGQFDVHIELEPISDIQQILDEVAALLRLPKSERTLKSVCDFGEA